MTDTYSRPATKREERRYGRKLVREWNHSRRGHMECVSVFVCFRCAWRTISGAREREIRDFIARSKDTRIPTIKVEVTDEKRERWFELRQSRAVTLSGQVVCALDDHHDETPCPDCGATV